MVLKRIPQRRRHTGVSSKSLYLMINYIVINLQLLSFTKQRYTHYTVYKCTTTCLRNVIFVEAPGAFLKVYFCHTVFTALRAKSTGTWQDRHESLFMEFPAATGWERDCTFNEVQSCWFTFHFKRPKAPTFICLLYVQHKRDIKRILKYDKVATTTTISTVNAKLLRLQVWPGLGHNTSTMLTNTGSRRGHGIQTGC